MVNSFALRAGLLALICVPWAGRAADKLPTTQHADAPGIAWFDGDVPQAFAAAGKVDEPVFLYWGAKWCPPCQQLKSSVFSRSDFIAKTRQFVAVYLDGDAPGAQKWGEVFHVSGYPTVVILRPDRREITRISGGVDLSLYADLLDAALGDIKPLSAVLATLRARPAALSTADCRRLVYYAWETGAVPEKDRRLLAGHLFQAATVCPGLSPIERARLDVISASFAPVPRTVNRVLKLLADPDVAPRLVDNLETLGDPFFAVVAARGATVSAEFVRHWSDAMTAVANDPKVIDADRLVAVGMQLLVAKQFADPHEVPASLAAAARAHVAAALAKPMDAYVRAGVVNAASFIDEQLGDDDANYAMLQSELKTAKAPYYYMVDLGEIEEKRGNLPAAIGWYERAYRESQGIATRFQWGYTYLAALLRLEPADHARIRSVGLEVLGELDGPDRIQARTRRRLETLDARLRTWNKEQHATGDVAALRERMTTICAKLPAEDTGQAACRKFLAPKA
jgi:thiol-disulfide isomerase/thioredoxin